MPSGDVHKAILDEVLREVSGATSLGNAFLDGLYRGVVEPDGVNDEIEVCRTVKEERRKVCRREPVRHHADDKVVKKLIDYYYLLSIYYHRHRDPYLSGITLGRALHYIQDSSFMYVGVGELSVQEERMRKVVSEASSIRYLCRGVEGTRKTPSNLTGVLCAMYRRTADMLKQFVNEVSRPLGSKEVEKLRRRYKCVIAVRIAITVVYAVAGLLLLPAILFLPLLFGLSATIMYIKLFIIISIAFLSISKYSRKLSSELAKAGMARPTPPTTKDWETEFKPAY